MLGLFPKLTVLHTKRGNTGQVYMPEVNWSLMVLTVAVTAGFRSTDALKEAYGMCNRRMQQKLPAVACPCLCAWRMIRLHGPQRAAAVMQGCLHPGRRFASVCSPS
jgi:hypothetical protein